MKQINIEIAYALPDQLLFEGPSKWMKANGSNGYFTIGHFTTVYRDRFA